MRAEDQADDLRERCVPVAATRYDRYHESPMIINET